MSVHGDGPTIVEANGYLVTTWPNGRPSYFLCSAEVIEACVTQINELRAFNAGLELACTELRDAYKKATAP